MRKKKLSREGGVGWGSCAWGERDLEGERGSQEGQSFGQWKSKGNIPHTQVPMPQSLQPTLVKASSNGNFLPFPHQIKPFWRPNYQIKLPIRISSIFFLSNLIFPQNFGLHEISLKDETRS